MRDSKSGKRHHLACIERNRMLARYNKECIDKPVRLETDEERKERLLKKEAAEKCKQTWQLHYIRKDDNNEKG